MKNAPYIVLRRLVLCPQPCPTAMDFDRSGIYKKKKAQMPKPAVKQKSYHKKG